MIVFKDGIVRTYSPQDRFRIELALNSDSRTNIVFTDSWTLSLKPQFSKDAKRSLEVDNAGGKSTLSEMMSIEYFTRVLNAQDILLEMEVEYWIDYKMVDFICTVPQYGRIGVSVTRAMGYPSSDKFTPDHALHLLRKKLYGLIVSRNGVTKKHSFFRSILHIWCQTEEIAIFLQNAYESFDIEDYGLDIKGVVILQLTICTHPSLYTNEIPRTWN